MRIHTTAIAQAMLAAAMVFTAIAVVAEGPQHHWNYEHHNEGPGHWGDLDPAFETCAKGNNQSPVDIQGAVKANLPALQFHYGETASTLVNNGHTIQISVPSGQYFTVGDTRYELLQFHFHSPSEEALNGKRLSMVAHFVHRNAAGELGVVAVLVQPGPTNAAFAPVFDKLPRPGDKTPVEGLSLDLAAMLPTDKGYYALEGSLTTPPCSEGVHWMILKTPISLSVDQIKAFRRIFTANARPLQPLNGRVIRESM